MSLTPSFDLASAHRYFSASCFNGAWELIERTDRSAADDVRLVAEAQASLWHWLERPDRTAQNLSIAYWQLARVYAVVGNAAEARRYGELCLEGSANEAPFYLGYAHEALARAARIAGDEAEVAKQSAAAAAYAAQVEDAAEREALEKDLATLA